MLPSMFDMCRGHRDLPGDEILAPAGRFMVEQNAVGREDVVGLAVIDDNPVRVQLGDTIGTAGIERCLFVLKRGPHLSKELTCRRLIEARLHARFPDRVQEPERPHGVDLGRVLGDVERHLHMALCRKVVDLIRRNLLEYAVEVGRIGHIAVVQEEPVLHQPLVLNVQMIDPPPVEGAAAADDAVHFVPLVQKQFREV